MSKSFRHNDKHTDSQEEYKKRDKIRKEKKKLWKDKEEK